MKVFILLLLLLLFAACNRVQENIPEDNKNTPSLEEEVVDESFNSDGEETTEIDELDAIPIAHFAETDILPFVYQFPTVPRMWVLMEWPIGGVVFETDYMRFTSRFTNFNVYGTFIDVINQFKALMHISGFERVAGMYTALDPNIPASSECIVFQQDNIFVSIEKHDTYIASDGETDFTLSPYTIRMAKIDGWVASEIIEVDISMLSNEELELLAYEAQYDFFTYQNIYWLVGIPDHEGESGRFSELEFSLQQLINSPPIHISFTVGHNAIEFLYELETPQYYTFLEALDALLSQTRIRRIYEFTPAQAIIYINGHHLTYLLDSPIIYSGRVRWHTWDIFINEKPATNENTKQFTITILSDGFRFD